MMSRLAAHVRSALRSGTCCASTREAVSRKLKLSKSCSRSYAEATPGFPALPASQQIAAATLSLEPGLKSFYCTWLVFVELDPPLPRPPDSAPLTDQGGITEQ